MSNSQTDENNRTTYARAVLEYDKQHGDELLSAITKAIVDTSMVSDCNRRHSNRRNRRGPGDNAGIGPRHVAIGIPLANGNPQDRR